MSREKFKEMLEICIHGQSASVSLGWNVHLQSATLADSSLRKQFETLLAEKLALLGKDTVMDPHMDYFEYEDDEGDRLAVKTDQEFQDMLSFAYNSKIGYHGYPLHIYPRVCGNAEKKSFGLRVDTGSRVSPVASPPPLKAESFDTDSLFRGVMSRSDLKYGSLKLMNVIGSGHCGTVYRALDVEKDRLLAVKCVSLDICSDVQNQILAEMDVLHKCSCPYIIDFYGALFVDNQFWICTEYMNAGSLDRFQKIPEKVLIHISLAVLLGLSYLWNLRIMHRDVKPSNILLNQDGMVKICDFGVSVELQRSIAKSYVGTNAYMAPERILGGDYRICSDMWSFGLTILEMISGRFPFTSDTSPQCSKPFSMMERILTQDAFDECRDCFEDEDFCGFVAQCVKRDPEQRPNPETLLQHPLMSRNTPIDYEKIKTWISSAVSK